MDDLQPALSALLSLRSSSIHINGALSRLNACLASIALEAASSTPVAGWREDQLDGHNSSSSSSSRRTAFLKSQASFQHNVAARLVEFIARCLLRLQNIKYGDDYQAIFVQLGQSMKLLQGFLLLHPASRDLFSFPCNMELLVTCITLPDQSAIATPSTSSHLLSESAASSIAASPTLASIPFDFGASTSARAESDQPPTLAELTLETLLCALVDAPENGKLFEELGGVADVVRVLRGKVDGGKGAKMKALEFLYFWLYPDPQRPKQAKDNRPTPPTTPRKTSQAVVQPHAAMHTRSDSTDSRLRYMLESTHDGWAPTTPSKPSRTFEHTQLALSRSAAALGRSTPRKRSARLSFSMREEMEQSGSPRAKRPSLVAGQPPARLESSLSAARRSPDARRRSMLGSSHSLANLTRPSSLTPPREAQVLHIRRSSTLRTASTADEEAIESYLFKEPKLPASPSVDRIRSSRPVAMPRSETASCLVAHPLAASVLSPRKPRQIAAEDLPGSAGSTKGLFAPSRRSSPVTAPCETTSDRPGPNLLAKGKQELGTRERRRQVLSKYMGNVDQLLERFEGLRCSTDA